jgi:hypothetical protein
VTTPLTITITDRTSLPAVVTALCEVIAHQDERGAVLTSRTLRSIAQQLQAAIDADGAPVRAYLEKAYPAKEPLRGGDGYPLAPAFGAPRADPASCTHPGMYAFVWEAAAPEEPSGRITCVRCMACGTVVRGGVDPDATPLPPPSLPRRSRKKRANPDSPMSRSEE